MDTWNACCVLVGDKVKGRIWFVQPAQGGPVHITGKVTGLSPGLHGFHIHEYGDIRQGCVSTGGHYNPFERPHAGPQDKERHIGDLGNIEAAVDGVSTVNITDSHISLFGPQSIIGRAVVVHENEDDLGRGGHSDSVTTGHARGRVTCGVIGICKQ